MDAGPCSGVVVRNILPRGESRKVPVWICVPRRLPRAPKMLPRMPIAAGTSTRSPGSSFNVPVIDPSVMPAMRSPPEESRSATKPARTPAASARKNATKRAPTRREERSIGNEEDRP